MFRRYNSACLIPAALLAVALGQVVAQAPRSCPAVSAPVPVTATRLLHSPPALPRCQNACPAHVPTEAPWPGEVDMVALEVKLVSVPPGMAEELLADGSPVSLDDAKVKELLEAVQANVLSSPKMLVLNGQRATACVGEQQEFVTGIEVTVKDGQRHVLPKKEKLATGFEVSVLPTVSADHRFIRLALKAELRSVDNSTSPFPVVTVLQPDGDPEGKPVALTQLVQRPKAQTASAEGTFTAPEGRTVVFDAGTRKHAVREVSKVPVLGDVPCLQGVFTKTSTRQEEEQILVLVTPRLLPCQKQGWRKEAARGSEPLTCCSTASVSCPTTSCQKAATSCPCRKPCGGDVASLVSAYRAACAEGRVEEAKDLATKALGLDPTCFCNPRPTTANTCPCQEKARK